MSAARVERVGPGWLRRDAERISGALPPLMVEAQRLAATVSAGVHGRRRAGPGETFWQYRQAMPGDPLTSIDWRRSARSDHVYIREMEWESAQTVWIWRDDALSMDYRSDAAPRTKGERAALLAMALSVLLVRGGERVGLMGSDAQRPLSGETQLRRLALALSKDREGRGDVGAPPPAPFQRGGKAVFLSDFFGPLEPLEAAMTAAAQAGVRGSLVQILDPAEEAFPFDGRMIFESMGGEVDFETHRARGLAEAYRKRLAERRDALDRLARRCGWRLTAHHTDVSPRRGLIWLYGAVSGGAV
ncbi:DUF58 domain-containing protein [Rubrimonas cliftonensis]|uniref:DUF58 domain-containing protein n=1 Tax=Rubrimonas cliftonensis TaxID=89524 RepID=UPI001FE11A98|nr:DUF58 domain-containing protein [Rubrimonas cliftonensis]